jgi:hypothetical protein
MGQSTRTLVLAAREIGDIRDVRQWPTSRIPSPDAHGAEKADQRAKDDQLNEGHNDRCPRNAVV